MWSVVHFQVIYIFLIEYPQMIMNVKCHILTLVQFFGRNFLSGCFKHLYLKVSSGLARPSLTWGLYGSYLVAKDQMIVVRVLKSLAKRKLLRTLRREKMTVGLQESLPIPFVVRIGLAHSWSILVSVACSLGRREQHFSGDIQQLSRRNSIANIVTLNSQCISSNLSSIVSTACSRYLVISVSEYSPVGEGMRDAD